MIHEFNVSYVQNLQFDRKKASIIDKKINLC